MTESANLLCEALIRRNHLFSSERLQKKRIRKAGKQEVSKDDGSCFPAFLIFPNLHLAKS